MGLRRIAVKRLSGWPALAAPVAANLVKQFGKGESEMQ